ncbi:hypothetical protein CR513_49804, partial [Mucuna pruriens]
MKFFVMSYAWKPSTFFWEDHGNLTNRLHMMVYPNRFSFIHKEKLPVAFEKMFEGFKDISLKDMPKGLPPIQGIEH